MTEQLRADGEDAILVRPPQGWRAARAIVRVLPRQVRSALVIQYNPFSWGRWGFTPQLVVTIGLVRLLRPRACVMLMVHEAYVPMRDLRWRVMGTWQRLQIRALLALAHDVCASTGLLEEELARGWPSRRVEHLPVGSNLPDGRSARDDSRQAWGCAGRLVVATFTGGHETHLHEWVLRSAVAIAQAVPRPVILLVLGRNGLTATELPGVERTIAPGYLDEGALAGALAAVDVFLAPFLEGATTRRTTLMAAMQHALAIVTTASSITEPELCEGGALTFAAVNDPAAFTAQAIRLASDEQLRERHAMAARALYERRFAWPVLAARLRRACGVDQEPQHEDRVLQHLAS
jgi:glycosyltransferase involved in cell wall biosynthesis